jgi:threonine dehydrogenase-like Zn-dependent dehydrogenase
MGNCHHRRYLPKLVELLRAGTVDPLKILAKAAPISGAIAAYAGFDRPEPGGLRLSSTPLPNGAA